jgi:two-component system, OmpR family, response regulator MprA
MTDPQPVGAPKKILVVDDNLVIRKVVEMKLKACGYEVVTAKDGSAAVSSIQKEKPDLILLDILFPPDLMEGGMSWDGFAIMRWLHNMMSGADDVPVIIISGTDPAKYRDRCLAAGATAYLHKPLNMDELLATVQLALGETAPAA